MASALPWFLVVIVLCVPVAIGRSVLAVEIRGQDNAVADRCLSLFSKYVMIFNNHGDAEEFFTLSGSVAMQTKTTTLFPTCPDWLHQSKVPALLLAILLDVRA